MVNMVKEQVGTIQQIRLNNAFVKQATDFLHISHTNNEGYVTQVTHVSLKPVISKL